MKSTIEQLEVLLMEMKKAKAEHPKAAIYYDWKDHELRITYPLPRDFINIRGLSIRTVHQKNIEP